MNGSLRRWWRLALGLALAAMSLAAAGAGLTQADVARYVPAPLTVGERDATLPVWPIFRRETTANVLAGYVFESIDFAPIPGFSGTPLNLLIALDADGRYLGLRVLSHHEPVFLEGLGEGPLLAFVAQYPGLSLKQTIKIGSNANHGDKAGSAAVYIDGVAKATASVRIVNQTVLAAALQVARAKLGYAAGRDPAQAGRVKPDYEPMSWKRLVQAGWVQQLRFDGGEIERAFAGSPVEGLPSDAEAGPAGAPWLDLWVAYLNAPMVGRNLLGEAGWQRLQGRLEPGDHALLVIGRGRYSFVGEHFTRGAVPDRLTLRQGELPLELRDLDLDEPLALPEALRGAEAKAFRVIGPAGLDPALPLDFALRVTRSKGIVYPERVSRDFRFRYSLPASAIEVPVAEARGWRAVWHERGTALAVLVGALLVLTLALARQHWLAATPRRLAAFRTGFLLFTLVFIGWIAQGQLSIVNLTALVQALASGRSLDFFLYDPMTVLLWGYTAIALVAWGRGVFCGWLCPFGALQDLVGRVAQRLGVRRLRLHRRLDARLKWLKYALLALTLGSAASSQAWTDRVVEIEPFKTAITLGFVRQWPYVLWAVALVLLGSFVYKGYCRYLCPLGAGLALLGRLRLRRWIPRRAECGTPCQTCRHRCEYQAIDPSGAIDYEECFQCLDCVAIHDSDQRCAPLIARRRVEGRVIAIRPLPMREPG